MSEEEKKFALMMLPKKKKVLYDKIMHSKKKKAAKVPIYIYIYLFIYLFIYLLAAIDNDFATCKLRVLYQLVDWTFTFKVQGGFNDRNVCLRARDEQVGGGAI